MPPTHQPFSAAPWLTLAPSLNHTIHPSSDSKTPRINNPNSNKSAQRVSEEETNSSGGLRHPRMGPAVNPATIHSRLIRPAHDKSYEGSKWSLETQLEAVRYGWARNQSGSNPRRMGGQTRAVGILRGGAHDAKPISNKQQPPHLLAKPS